MANGVDAAEERAQRAERARAGRERAAPLIAASLTAFVALHGMLATAQGHLRQLVWGTPLLLALGGLCAWFSPRLGRFLSTVGLLALAGLCAFGLFEAPELALTGLLGIAGLLLWLWRRLLVGPAHQRHHDENVGVSLTASLALAAWFLVVPANAAEGLAATVACALVLVLAHARGVTAMVTSATAEQRWLRFLTPSALTAVVAIGGALLALVPGWSGWALSVLAAPVAVVVVWRWRVLARATESLTGWISAVLVHPARLLVVTFLALCALGAGLLALPASSAGAKVAPIDAAFTAVSAVCVTGLSVVDTAQGWSGFGKGVLLLLIQLGGLGIMTFYAAAIPLLGKRLSLVHERTIAGALSIEDRGNLYRSLGRVLSVTFGSEALGAAVLWVEYLRAGETWLSALWKAVFTAISAFCNAGFALHSDNLVGFQDRPIVLHTVATLIILGGLSPTAVALVPRWLGWRGIEWGGLGVLLRAVGLKSGASLQVKGVGQSGLRQMLRLPRLVTRRPRPLPLQVRLVYTTSLGLLAFGMVGFAVLEWHQTLDGMPLLDKLHNAWFQSVTLRTAGFNSVPLEQTQVATQALMIALMFIGASPGGTGGGIKTTTFAALTLAVVAALRGHADAVAYGRRLKHAAIYKAAAVTTLGLLSAVAVLLTILASQSLTPPVAVFEVISALATVGLSLGGTGELDHIGMILIMGCMFAGRVGPLTLFMFLAERRRESPWVYPAEELDVG